MKIKKIEMFQVDLPYAHGAYEITWCLISMSGRRGDNNPVAVPLPEKMFANRYPCMLHGVGMCDEYPFITYTEDFDESGYDGVFEAGMTVCVEAYGGEVSGREGVKLEEQVLITETGAQRLSSYPFEEDFL